MQPQFAGNFVGNFLLDKKNVSWLTIVLRTPQLRACRYIHQFGSDNQRAASLRYCSSEDGAHPEFAANGLRANFLALIPKYGALRHHSQFRQCRQDIDKAPSDSVAEVFVVRVATRIFEG